MFGKKEHTGWAIRNWWLHFEIAQSRRARYTAWFACPNKHDGKGWRRLARHEANQDGSILCAFYLMCEIASKMPVRGLLADEDGPLTSLDMSDATGYAAGMFETAFPILSAPQILWLEHITPALRADYEREQSGLGVCSTTDKQTDKQADRGGRPARVYPRDLLIVKSNIEQERTELFEKRSFQHTGNRTKYSADWSKWQQLGQELKRVQEKLTNMSGLL